MNPSYTWTMKQFGRRLRTLRNEKGLSQADLARMAKTHPMQVGKYERGEGFPAVETLAALSRALEVSIDYLLTGEEHDSERNEDAFHFPLLLEKVRELDREIDRRDVATVLDFLDAYLAKKRIKKMMAG